VRPESFGDELGKVVWNQQHLMPWHTLLQVKTNVPDTAEGQQVSETPNRTASMEKTLMLGDIDDRRKRATENEMVGWHHQLDGPEFEQTPGDGDGQGSLARCSPWGQTEETEQQQSGVVGVEAMPSRTRTVLIRKFEEENKEEKDSSQVSNSHHLHFTSGLSPRGSLPALYLHPYCSPALR